MGKERDSQTERDLALYVLEPQPGDSKDVLAFKRLLAPVYNGLFTIGAKQTEHEHDCKEWRRGVDDRLDKINTKLLNDYHSIEDLKKTVEEKEEITGVQHKEELLGTIAEYRENAKWWKRWVLGIVAGFILLFGGGTVGYVVKSALASGQSVTGRQ